jgi:hypothetical protein
MRSIFSPARILPSLDIDDEVRIETRIVPGAVPGHPGPITLGVRDHARVADRDILGFMGVPRRFLRRRPSTVVAKNDERGYPLFASKFSFRRIGSASLRRSRRTRISEAKPSSLFGTVEPQVTTRVWETIL